MFLISWRILTNTLLYLGNKFSTKEKQDTKILHYLQPHYSEATRILCVSWEFSFPKKWIVVYRFISYPRSIIDYEWIDILTILTMLSLIFPCLSLAMFNIASKSVFVHHEPYSYVFFLVLLGLSCVNCL